MNKTVTTIQVIALLECTYNFIHTKSTATYLNLAHC